MPRNGNSIIMTGKHSMPRPFCVFYLDLMALEGVVQVYPGKWANRGSSQKNIVLRVQYYDGTTRTMKIVSSYEGYIQSFFVRLDSNDSVMNIENFIYNYGKKRVIEDFVE